jgi:hypothetical protein
MELDRLVGQVQQLWYVSRFARQPASTEKVARKQETGQLSLWVEPWLKLQDCSSQHYLDQQQYGVALMELDRLVDLVQHLFYMFRLARQSKHESGQLSLWLEPWLKLQDCSGEHYLDQHQYGVLQQLGIVAVAVVPTATTSSSVGLAFLLQPLWTSLPMDRQFDDFRPTHCDHR